MREKIFGPARRRLCVLAMAVAAAFALGLPGMQASGAAQHVSAAVSAQQRILIPGGKSLGIAVATEGMVLVGTSDLGSLASPARAAGLKPGDIITEVDGQQVRSAEELLALLEAGEPAALTVVRNDREKQFSLTPAADPRDGRARIGAWVRSSTAGVGTLTFIDPGTGRFGALGHAISDVDTGILMPIADGAIYESEIVRITKGEKGLPGELVGDFLTDERKIGTVEKNNITGIYGSYSAADLSGLPYPEGLPVGTREEVHPGQAEILTTLDDGVHSYAVEIERIEPDSGSPERSFLIRVTDEELLERTGGIVQGMSGSPIIQDGKLVGAVTHVLVNDPTKGYGIFIENMLDAAE